MNAGCQVRLRTRASWRAGVMKTEVGVLVASWLPHVTCTRGRESQPVFNGISAKPGITSLGSAAGKASSLVARRPRQEVPVRNLAFTLQDANLDFVMIHGSGILQANLHS